MEKLVNKISFILVVLGFVIAYFLSATFGLLVWIVGLIVAIVSAVKHHKGTQLPGKDFVADFIRTKTFDFISFVTIVIFPEFFVYCKSLEELNEIANSTSWWIW